MFGHEWHQFKFFFMRQSVHYDQPAFALVLNAHTMATLKKMWKYLQLRSDENHAMDVQRYGRARIMISNTQKL